MASKSILEVAGHLTRLRDLAAAGKLSPSDLNDGTITLSNIGNIGGTTLHPVIVSNELCIGSIGRAQVLPRFNENGEVVRKEILPISWSADHRVVDGATMARFVGTWKALLEDPGWMMVKMR